MFEFSSRQLGASYLGNGRCRFWVWAPRAQQVEVQILGSQPRHYPMQAEARGYFHAIVDDVQPGALYRYRLDGSLERTDPASRSQPEGVHGPSQVVDSQFDWHDQTWRGLPLHEFVLYELHVGTFTSQGTFAAIIDHLDDLKDLGITAIELLPVAQFPGTRNWGYDGVYPYATQNSYGGPDGLRHLVDACHARSLAVVMDVVYNHLGPEGSYLADFGHYFTARYQTPWGAALNFDGHHSDEVRRFFLENALFWVRDMHIDALRLDAVHAIFDESARPFLKELAETVRHEAKRSNRRIYTIAESNKNDARHIQSADLGGYGLDCQWNDDFHHSLHTLLTGEQDGYYVDFSGLKDLATALREGFVFSGQYSPFAKRSHGVPSTTIPPERFVIFAQNHDQTGNRLYGDRRSQLVSFEQLKLTAGLLLLSPYIPMLFMGEEYGEPAPFQYFVSHSDPDLIAAVQRGRREEFEAFAWQGEVPDPQSEEAFRKSTLNHQLRQQGHHRALWQLHQALLRLRKTVPALTLLSKRHLRVDADVKSQTLILSRRNGESRVCALFNFSEQPSGLSVELAAGSWTKALDSNDQQWLGGGSGVPVTFTSSGEFTLELPPRSFVVLLQDQAE